MARSSLQPVFVSRQQAAELLSISVDTFDTWVRSSFIPAPHIDRGQIVRWHWPSIESALATPSREPHHDPSVMGVLNAQKGRRRAAA